ncbi:MAG TPA: DUF4142 domain-containing protein [Sphingobacteriaceae bacterium]
MKNTALAALLIFAATAFTTSTAQVTPPGTAAQGVQDTAAASFVSKARMANMMEIETGQLAQQKGADQDVKQFGSRMVQDHTAADEQLKQLVRNKQLDASAQGTPDPKMASAADKLKQASGADFDKEYITLQIKGHMKNIMLFEKASRDVQDPEIRDFAVKTLPALREHLEMAQAIAKRLNIDVSGMGGGSPGMNH